MNKDCKILLDELIAKYKTWESAYFSIYDLFSKLGDSIYLDITHTPSNTWIDAALIYTLIPEELITPYEFSGFKYIGDIRYLLSFISIFGLHENTTLNFSYAWLYDDTIIEIFNKLWNIWIKQWTNIVIDYCHLSDMGFKDLLDLLSKLDLPSEFRISIQWNYISKFWVKYLYDFLLEHWQKFNPWKISIKWNIFKKDDPHVIKLLDFTKEKFWDNKEIIEVI